MLRVTSLALALAACARDPLPPITVHLGTIVDADGVGRTAQAVEVVGGGRDLVIDPDGRALVVEAALGDGTPVTAELDGAPPEVRWFRARPIAAPVTMHLAHDGVADVTIVARGTPAPAARVERSLAWTDPALLDDRAVVGLGRVMAAVADDGHGGRLLDAWLHRFATTAHSERAGPAQLADQIAAAQGADPGTWDLDALPFVVTAIYDRLDLAARDGGCGQLRVAFASTDPIYAPLDLIFLFRQEPDPDDDVAPDGAVHCLGTARRWARLSALDGPAWLAAARAFLAERLVHERFLRAETVELTVSPWEWRQWVWAPSSDPALARAFDNPPLFQTIDPALVNPAGPTRDAFLAFVAANADGLVARTVEIPEAFRARSQRVAPGAQAEPIAVSDPALASALGVIGCPTCHTHDADFQQVSPARVFSPFTTKELAARAARLDVMTAGDAVPIPPFGPLQ